MSCNPKYIRSLTANEQEQKQLDNIHNTIFNKIIESKLFRKFEGKYYLPPVGGQRYLAAKAFINNLNTTTGFPVAGTDFTKGAKEYVFVNVRNYLPQVKQQISSGFQAQYNQLNEQRRGGYTQQQGGEFFKDNNVPATVASPQTVRKVKEFMDRIGVDYISFTKEEARGLGYGNIEGIADMLHGIIGVVEGKEEKALTEEAVHFAVAIVKQTNPTLYREMFNKIGNYQIYDLVKNNTAYTKIYRTEDGKLDVPKLKEEAIGKLITEMVLEINDGNSFTDSFTQMSEEAERVAAAQSWWQKVLNWFKQLFQKANFDPFTEVAQQITSNTLEGSVDIIAEEYSLLKIQDNPEQAKLYDSILDISNKVAKTDTGFSINDNPIKRKVVYEHELNKKPLDKNLSNKGHQDINHIMKRLVDDDGFLRKEPLPMFGKPNLNPSGMEAYQLLFNNISSRLNAYEAGTRFLYNTNIYDKAADRAANVDFIAISPTGKVDILTWEFVNRLSQKRGDVPFYERESIQNYIGSLKKILREAYGIRNFGQTRGIPIIINYSAANNGIVLKGIKIGSASVDIKDKDFLQPIPARDELTGNAKIDKFIIKLNALYKNTKNAPVSEGRKDVKAEQLNALYKAIRHLQINENFKPLFKQIDILIKSTETIMHNHDVNFANKMPSEYTNAEINEEAGKLISSIEALNVYKGIDIEFKDYFRDENDKEDLDEIRRLGSSARSIIDDLEGTYKDFAERYISSKREIRGLLNAEKSTPWIPKQFRTLSQAPTAATQTLWLMAEEARNKTEFATLDAIEELASLQDAVTEWGEKGGKKPNEYADLIKRKENGRITNHLIDQYDKDFYIALKNAVEKKDITWIKQNVDKEKYKQWANEYRDRKFKQINETYYGGTPEEQEKRRKAEKQIVAEKTNYGSDSGWFNYAALRQFPLDKWHSAEYKELSKPENKPVMDLYNFIIKWNKKAVESEYLSHQQGRKFLPFIRKTLAEKVVFGGSYNWVNNVVANLTIDDQSIGYGNFNNLTGEIDNTIPKYFTSDISIEKKDKDGNLYKDYSNVSEDIFKNMAIYINQVINYSNKREMENQSNLLLFVEKNKQSLVVLPNGNVLRDALGLPELSEGNEVNSKLFHAYMKNVVYGQKYTNTESADMLIGKVGKGWNKVANAVNNRFNTNIPLISEEIGDRKISGTRLLDQANRFYSLKVLGLNVGSSLAQFLGGNFQAFVNAGKYYNLKEFFAAELKFSGHKFISDKADIHLAMMKTFLPLAEGELHKRMNKLTLSKVTTADLSNTIMYLMRTADNVVQYANFLAMMDNAIVIDGKLRNVRDYYRNSNEYKNRYSLSYSERKKIEDNFEDKLKELRDEFGIAKFAEVVDGKLKLNGVSTESVHEYRSLLQQIGKKAAGNITPNDENLIRLNVLGRSFMVFKNWIPGLLDVRFTELRYNVGTDAYEWGRMRMATKFLFREGFKSIVTLRNMLIANDKGIEALRRLFEDKKKDYFNKNNKELEMTEEEFFDLVRQNIKSQYRDTILFISLIAMFMAAKSMAPDDGEDEHTKAFYRYSVRALDNIKNEMSFYYNPLSLQHILNGSIFPSLGILTDATNILTNTLQEGFGLVIQDDEIIDGAHPAKYFMKTFPITKEMLNYIAIGAPEMGKTLGIQLNPNATRN